MKNPTVRLRALMLAVTIAVAVVASQSCGPKLPPVSGCEPLSQRCEGDRATAVPQ